MTEQGWRCVVMWFAVAEPTPRLRNLHGINAELATAILFLSLIAGQRARADCYYISDALGHVTQIAESFASSSQGSYHSTRSVISIARMGSIDTSTLGNLSVVPTALEMNLKFGPALIEQFHFQPRPDSSHASASPGAKSLATLTQAVCKTPRDEGMFARMSVYSLGGEQP